MPEIHHSIKTVLGEPYYSRFWSRVAKTETCWLWTGGVRRDGYGRFFIGSRGYSKGFVVHRLTYEMLIGRIPESLTLDHLCRVRHCCNPDHLEPVSIGENVLRGETIPARFARRTHCTAGHDLAEARQTKYGRHCLVCAKQWRIDHRDEFNAWRRKDREENPEKRRNQDRSDRQRHRDKRLAYKREYRQRNRDKLNMQKREWRLKKKCQRLAMN